MKNLNLHFRRFEFKYPMKRAVANQIIPEILRFMVWDDYAAADEGYRVNSLYYDRGDFKAHHDKLDGLMHRKKVRVRWYGKDQGQVFFELKRKSGDVILKDRILVKGDDFEKFQQDSFALGRMPAYQGDFLEEFLYELASFSMRPAVMVSYLRRPFFARLEKGFRVTFDSDLSFDGEVVGDDLVIMEVKFNGAMPQWFHGIIERFKLTKSTFSKYCEGVVEVFGLPAYY